jgi:hypothetical protein
MTPTQPSASGSAMPLRPQVLRPEVTARLDAAVGIVGLVLRAGAYLLLAHALAGHEVGRTVLRGLVLGDLVASVLLTMVPTFGGSRTHGRLAHAVGAAVLAGVWGFGESLPAGDPATTALVGLAGFGAFVGRVGRAALTHLGPSED